MGRIKVRYLNVYYALTGKKEETVAFADPLTLGDLVEKVVQSGGRKFKESILDDENALRPYVWDFGEPRARQGLSRRAP